MGNTFGSGQDHYEVLGVHPEATETKITKAFRSAALKWHPTRSPGEIDEAYRVLSDPIGRTAYDKSRLPGGGWIPKGVFYSVCVVIAGIVTYRLWQSGKLEEIGQTAIDGMYAFVNWASELTGYNTASDLRSQLATSARALASASMEVVSKVGKYVSELKDSETASALGSQIATSASSLASASMEAVSEVGKFVSELKDSETASALGSQIATSASSLASASMEAVSEVGKFVSELKDSETASQIATSASSLASASMEAVSEVGKFVSELKDSETASQIATSASSLASASMEGVSKVAKWF